MEVVFHCVAKSILFLCFFGFEIYPYILFHFKKCFLLFSFRFYFYFLQEWCPGDSTQNLLLIRYYNFYSLLNMFLYDSSFDFDSIFK